jgi:hypothetical protein
LIDCIPFVRLTAPDRLQLSLFGTRENHPSSEKRISEASPSNSKNIAMKENE